MLAGRADSEDVEDADEDDEDDEEDEQSRPRRTAESFVSEGGEGDSETVEDEAWDELRIEVDNAEAVPDVCDPDVSRSSSWMVLAIGMGSPEAYAPSASSAASVMIISVAIRGDAWIVSDKEVSNSANMAAKTSSVIAAERRRGLFARARTIR